MQQRELGGRAKITRVGEKKAADVTVVIVGWLIHKKDKSAINFLQDNRKKERFHCLFVYS